MDIQSRNDIRLLVDTFYAKIETDDLLGPIFHQIIKGNWEPHLQKMVNFWDSLLFHQPVYNGQPYPKHADLPITEIHFNRWIQLFNQCIDQLFDGPLANRAKEIGSNVAHVFLAKMYPLPHSLPIV
jgi:hemoglobin